MRTLSLRLIAMVVFALLAPASARAQALWGEPINPPGDRFIVLDSYLDQAVYDKETGLVWEQSPDTTARVWTSAQFNCNAKTVGNRKGWRFPTIQELASLVDPAVPSPGPTLPAGHPFSNVQSSLSYWSATTVDVSSGSAWIVAFSNGSVITNNKSFMGFSWCLRGGQGVNPQ